MDMQLKDKTALVTGASTGIGRGIALCLAAEGVRLAISARRVALLEQVADEIVAAGGYRPVVIESDLYADDAAQRLAAAAVAGLGHVDILVNNAGGTARPDPLAHQADPLSGSVCAGRHVRNRRAFGRQ